MLRSLSTVTVTVTVQAYSRHGRITAQLQSQYSHSHSHSAGILTARSHHSTVAVSVQSQSQSQSQCMHTHSTVESQHSTVTVTVTVTVPAASHPRCHGRAPRSRVGASAAPHPRAQIAFPRAPSRLCCPPPGLKGGRNQGQWGLRSVSKEICKGSHLVQLELGIAAAGWMVRQGVGGDWKGFAKDRTWLSLSSGSPPRVG
eukprot:1176629-Prorocentrum_minimum.AAC.1